MPAFPVFRYAAVAAFLLLPCGSDRRLNAGGQSAPRPGMTVTEEPNRRQDARSSLPGVVRGRVVAWDTGRPLRRVAVRLTGAMLRTALTVGTNDEGYYAFTRVPPGRYGVAATKTGYLAAEFGQRHAQDPGRPLELAPAQELGGIDFRLVRTSAITGRVLDELGDPVPEAVVQAMRTRFVQGRRRLLGAASVRANDIGEFRIAGLSPGPYYVRTIAVGRVAGDLPPAGYAPTFYPAASSAPDAQVVRLSAGQDASGVEISMIPARNARLSGIVMDLRGRPLDRASVRLVPIFSDPGWSEALDVGSISTRAGGRFALGDVAPGDYRLEAYWDGDAPQSSEFASRLIAVTGDDVPDITLMTSPGGTAFGQIVTPTGRRPSFLLDRLGVYTRAGSPTESARGAGSRAVVRAGWFELSGLLGARLFRVAGLPADWTLKAVTHQGRDITDVPLEFTGSERFSGIRIELTDRVTELTGTVYDDSSRPAPEGVVLVFAENSTRWGFESRFVRVARVDAAGRFALTGLPPDAYLATAVDDLGLREWDDPDLLEALRPHGFKFTLKDEETRTLDLRSLTAVPARP